MLPTDVTEVAALEQENPSPWSMDSLGQELAISGALQFVAECMDGQLAGWCACRVLQPEAELLKIAVRQHCRHGGIGGLLLQHLFEALQKRRIASLFLEVRAKNLPALSFYKKHGFIHVGDRPGYYTEPPDTAMILHKNLSA